MEYFINRWCLSKIVFIFGACIASVVFVLVVAPRTASAGLLLDAELRLTYEDNVVGLLSDQPSGGKPNGGPSGPMTAMAPMPPGGRGRGPGGNTGTGAQSKGDFSTSLFAEGGGYHDVNDSASVFAKAFAGHTSYDTYTEFDTTFAGAGAGIGLSLGDSVLSRAMIFGKVKRFGDSERDSSAYGGNLSLKEKLSTSFWLRESGEYEKNDADNSIFSYTGTKVGIEAGYRLAEPDLLSIGYSYLDQKFVEPAGADLKTNTFFVSAEHTIVKRWSVEAEYDLQLSEANDGGSATDNIYSVALRYSY